MNRKLPLALFLLASRPVLAANEAMYEAAGVHRYVKAPWCVYAVDFAAPDTKLFGLTDK